MDELFFNEPAPSAIFFGDPTAIGSVRNTSDSYHANVSAGDVVTVPDGSVTNTNGTYLFPLPATETHVVPDSLVENSDGTWQVLNPAAQPVTVPDTPIKNSEGTVLKNQPSCTEYEVADSQVVNSDASYDILVPAEQTLNLQDIAHTDALGRPVILPGMAPYDASIISDTWKDIMDKTYDFNLLDPSLIHEYYDDSAIPRRTAQTTSYTGTTYYVDASKADDTGNGLTPATAKKTITAAYNIASNGSIIQLADGAYNLALETSAYLLLNTHNKGVLIQGNAANINAVVLQKSAGQFAIRCRDCGYMKFKNLTITVSGAVYSVYQDYSAAYLNNNLQFEKCKFNHTSSERFFNIPCSSLSDSRIYNIDFISCSFDINTTQRTFDVGLASNTVSFLFTECQFIKSNGPVYYGNQGKNNIYFYDCQFTMNDNNLCICHGTDTETPTFERGLFDIRGCAVAYSAGYGQHALLIGRGTVNAYVINNIITMDSYTDSLRIGIVIKGTAATLGNIKIYGNYVNTPRPIYIKGGSNNDIRYNTAICNTAGFAGFEYVNYLDGATDVLSFGNNIENNTFIGIATGIKSYDGGTSEDESITIKTCVFKDNRYYFSTNYASINGTIYTWENRNDFWLSINEIGSVRLIDFHILIRYED